MQAGCHLIPQDKEAEQSYAAYTHSSKAFLAQTKLELRDASLPTRASLNARLWEEPVLHISVVQ
jgi:hypothetical protein